MPAVGYPVHWEADVLLRDGRPVHLRPITPADGAALRQFHGTLSARTVYFRFFAAKPELTEQDVEYFTRVDYADRVALVAVDRARILGVGRFDALGDGSAEVAFIIRDDCQGLGLGSILLEHLAEAARERGITRFVAEVLPANTRMLATFREAGYVVSAHREEDVIAVSFDIEPTADSRAVTAAREHRAEARSVQRLLHPRSVAVVGASRHAGGLGHQILVDLVDAGFTGTVVAVHPEVDEIAGVPCVRSLSDVGHEIDLVVVVVRAEAVASVIADAGQIGAHGLVIVSGGFGEAGEAGLARQAEVVGIAHATGIRVVGPNALGLINTDPAVRLNASLVRRMPRPGRVGFFSQSGALGSAILDRLETKGLGISTFVSAGNRADVSGNDLLQYWQDDASTDLVLLYVESMGNARKFARIVHALAHDKPVVMVRSGGAEHTHPLGHAVERTTLTQRGVDQILADCGLIVVDDIDELIDVGRVCVGQPLPSGPGVGVVGNSDALAVMAANAMGRTGLISANPAVTFPRGVGAAEFERAVHTAMDDPAVGSVLAIYVPAVEGDADEEIRAALVSCRICAGEHPKPVVAVMPGAVLRPADGGLAVFADVEDAVQALAAGAWLARWREYDRTKDVDDAPDDPDAPQDLAPGELRGSAALDLLAATTGLSVGPGSLEAIGCRIRLVSDPLYGPVIMVGGDDPVARALDDHAYRLAPVTTVAAREMLGSLGAADVLVGGGPPGPDGMVALASLVRAVSRLHLHLPGVREVDVRHAAPGPQAGVVVTDASIIVADEVIAVDPTARRL